MRGDGKVGKKEGRGRGKGGGKEVKMWGGEGRRGEGEEWEEWEKGAYIQLRPQREVANLTKHCVCVVRLSVCVFLGVAEAYIVVHRILGGQCRISKQCRRSAIDDTWADTCADTCDSVAMSVLDIVMLT